MQSESQMKCSKLKKTFQCAVDSNRDFLRGYLQVSRISYRYKDIATITIKNTLQESLCKKQFLIASCQSQKDLHSLQRLIKLGPILFRLQQIASCNIPLNRGQIHVSLDNKYLRAVYWQRAFKDHNSGWHNSICLAVVIQIDWNNPIRAIEPVLVCLF